MPEPPAGEVTRLLLAWQQGDAAALEALIPLLYDDLREIAARQLRHERSAITLQATGLVHEAYLRLVGTDMAWEGRRHFLAIAANTMRRILVDEARRRGRAKRGGGTLAISLTDRYGAHDTDPTDVILIDQLLRRLAEADPRKAQVVELHYFGGFDQREVADILDVSVATVERDLRFARTWMHDQMRPPA